MQLRVVVTLATAAVLAAGCADASPAPGSGGSPAGGIAHATGAADLVIRIDYEGGFVAPSYFLTAIPSFSLFGDGSIVTQGAQIEIYPQPALPAIDLQRVSEDGLQALLRAALDAGLGDAKSYTDMGSTGVADAATTVFTFNADGVGHTVKVYALAEMTERWPGMSAEEFAVRKRLADFQSKLFSLDPWLPAGSVGPSEPFTGAGARVYAGEYVPDGQLEQPPMAWPLDTPLGSFGSPTQVGGTSCGAVTGEDWTGALQPMAKDANGLTPWTSEGHRFAIAFRPLLPDETGC